MSRWLLVVMLASCGRVGFASRTDGDLTADSDASFPTDPWSNPVRLACRHRPTMAGPWLDRRELVLYWHSSRNGSRDLFMSTRSTADETFTTIVPMTELNSSSEEQDPWLSADGHTSIFVSDRMGDDDIYIATR